MTLKEARCFPTDTHEIPGTLGFLFLATLSFVAGRRGARRNERSFLAPLFLAGLLAEVLK
jgi:hypothetical protein